MLSGTEQFINFHMLDYILFYDGFKNLANYKSLQLPGSHFSKTAMMWAFLQSTGISSVASEYLNNILSGTVNTSAASLIILV